MPLAQKKKKKNLEKNILFIHKTINLKHIQMEIVVSLQQQDNLKPPLDNY